MSQLDKFLIQQQEYHVKALRILELIEMQGETYKELKRHKDITEYDKIRHARMKLERLVGWYTTTLHRMAEAEIIDRKTA